MAIFCLSVCVCILWKRNSRRNVEASSAKMTSTLLLSFWKTAIWIVSHVKITHAVCGFVGRRFQFCHSTTYWGHFWLDEQHEAGFKCTNICQNTFSFVVFVYLDKLTVAHAWNGPTKIVINLYKSSLLFPFPLSLSLSLQCFSNCGIFSKIIIICIIICFFS